MAARVDFQKALALEALLVQEAAPGPGRRQVAKESRERLKRQAPSGTSVLRVKKVLQRASRLIANDAGGLGSKLYATGWSFLPNPRASSGKGRRVLLRIMGTLFVMGLVRACTGGH